MKLYLIQKSKGVNAQAEYDVETKTFKVLKGSVVSLEVSHSERFRGTASIIKQRSNGVVKNGKVTQDVEFKSPSTAANFVTGASTNGMIAWKNENGEVLKSILSKEEE